MRAIILPVATLTPAQLAAERRASRKRQQAADDALRRGAQARHLDLATYTPDPRSVPGAEAFEPAPVVIRGPAREKTSSRGTARGHEARRLARALSNSEAA